MGVFQDIQTDIELASVKMVTEYRRRLLVDALKLCGNEADAEDLVSSVFNEMFAHDGGYDSKKGELYPYLRGILEHLYARTKRRAVNRGTVAVEPLVLAADKTLATTCTEDEIFAHSDHDALRAAIGRLPPDYRDAILLHYFSELPIAKVARVLSISEGTVKWRLCMARKILASELGSLCERGKKPLAVIVGVLLLVGAAFASWSTGLFGLLPEREEAVASAAISGETSPRTASPTEATLSTNSGLLPATTEERQMSIKGKALATALAVTTATALADYSDDYVSIDAGSVTAIDMGDDICYVFSNAVSGATLTTKSQMMLRSCLVVGGGGGGAGQIGGGGGGGGVEIASGLNQSIESGTVFTLSVGAGAAQNKSAAGQAYNGGHSFLSWGDTILWGYGGGGGGAWSGNSAVGVSTPAVAAVANEIGSGGGASYNASVGVRGETWFQGNVGGAGYYVNYGGGGGGASEAGNTRGVGCGGEGVTCDITGTPQVYGSGGGGGPQGMTRYPGGTNAGQGGCSNPGLEGEPGVDGFGGGGGGGAYVTTTCGGAGGCGTVILLFAKKDVSAIVFHLLPIVDQWHTGAAICPAVTAVYDADGSEVDPSKYDLVWEGNINAGVARVTAVGKGDHSGVSSSATFVIKACYKDENLATDDVSVRRIDLNGRFVYVFTNCAQEVVLRFNRTMTLVDGLVVGGGGAGGAVVSGGGGGGGVVTSVVEKVIVVGGEIAVQVGAGGAPASENDWTVPGGKGGDSKFDCGGYVVTAFGGAGGCGLNQGALAEGNFGSAGGGKGTGSYIDGRHYTASQGNVGAAGEGIGGKSAPGGGGGAGEPGHISANGVAGNGGEGITNSITGTAEVYGSGGGGGAGNNIATAGNGGTHAGGGAGKNTGIAAGSGDDGFGGGGGGGGYSPATAGGRGGSGIVVLAFTAGGSVAQPLISKIDVDFVNGTTQPKALVTLGCDDPNGKYSAAVRVQFGTSDGSWEFEGSVSDVQNGETAEILAPFSPAIGSMLWLRVTVTCVGAESVVETVDMPAEGIQSPCVGKGGGAGVIHVRPGATGRGDGSDWFHAMTDFRAAIERLDDEHPELWLSGDEMMDYSLVNDVNPVVPAVIRGGFAGTECEPGERVALSRSTIDGNSRYNCFTLKNAKALTLDGFLLLGRNNKAIAKTGVGDLMVTNCTVENCSVVGVNVSGSAESTIVRFATTRFEDLTAGTSGSALNVSSLRRVYLDDCQIVRCGVSLSANFGNTIGHMDSGHALYFNGVPVTMRGCVVKGCRAAALEKWAPGSGGVVRLNGACGGSAITNCAFVANETIHGYTTQDGNYWGDSCSGILAVSMDSGDADLDLVNCTFAYNVSEAVDAPAGLNIIKGTANVKNTIFSGAKVRRELNVASRDIWVRANGAANVSYTCFDEAGAECVGGEIESGALINLGAGVIYGDPLLVSTSTEFLGYLTVQGSFIGLDGAKDEELCEWANVHLRSKTGYVDEKTGEKVNGVGGVRFACYSPAIDAGDPASIYSLEPKPNGKRVNLGFYGNTPWASMSHLQGLLIVFF